ncbi:MAG: phenylalanine--tRNA ligase subunit alpha [Clostridia bacterium]|jgi:phenylalanyl-tRNA synthetase alpha chain|nr:phenylalanine--tRNA ligase subunit alpha [Clostridia bacterium]
MEENIEKLGQKIKEKIDAIKSMADAESVRVEALGKKGEVIEILKNLKNVEESKRKEVGDKANKLRVEIEELIEKKKEELKELEYEAKIKNAEKIDLTVPVDDKVGSLHPITIVSRELEDIFTGMGFTVEDGNEVETEYNNFEAVNVPKYHPARDMQDTFWLENGEVLKTQTSAAQNKIMKKYGAPLKAIFPGRCFRNEALDASHENTFFQMEGMMIDKNVSISNLIYFMKTLLSEVFKKEVEVRLRPGFFPFVEPGFELDIKCPYCGGVGCKVCKYGSWIELCPCGMIHPRVLEMGGIDPEEYSGFAFGLGLSRLAMMKYNINDLRALNSCDLRVLKQMKIK